MKVRDEEPEKLWDNHFYNPLNPPTSTESDTDCDNLPTGIHEEFKI
jgi:hypothetical protein